MIGMVIHIADGVFCGIYGTADDMKALEVFDIAGVTMGYSVFRQAIGETALCYGAAFLLAVMANHENSR